MEIIRLLIGPLSLERANSKVATSITKRLFQWEEEEVKPWSQGWLIAAGAYPGFCSMKRLEVFLLPLDGMLVHRRSLPHNFVRFPPTNSRYPFIHLGGERHCESKVSCSRTQHTVPGQGSNPDRSLRSRTH